MNAVMITLPGREGVSELTAGRLAEAGVKTKVFTQPSSWPVGPESNQKNAVRALLGCVGDVLFVEDDIVVKPQRLSRAVRSLDEITYLYVHDNPKTLGYYPESVFKSKALPFVGGGKKNKSTFLDLNSTVVEEGVWDLGDTDVFGSQAVFIPGGRREQIIDFSFNNITFEPRFQPRKSHSFDVLLNRFRRSFGVPSLVYMPHPVQHLESRVSRGPRVRGAYSVSFGLRSDLEVSDASGHD